MSMDTGNGTEGSVRLIVADETVPLVTQEKQLAPNPETHQYYTFIRVPRRKAISKWELLTLGSFILLIIYFALPWQCYQPPDEYHTYDPHSFEEDPSGQSSSKDKYYVAKLPTELVPTTYVHHSDSNRRLVILGDVHGVDVSLDDLLIKISFNPYLDHLILSGDMIDKGPSSHGVISRARALNASCVRGNHEDKVLAWYGVENDPLSDGTLPKDIDEWKITKDLTPEDLAWIQQCPLILRLGPLPGQKQTETVVVHAGILPGVTLKEQKPFDVMHMRSISEVKGKAKAKHGKKKHKKDPTKYRAYEDRKEGDSPWWKIWNKVQDRMPKSEKTMVIYGHDSKTGLNQKDWSVGLDSGCVAGGKLTALIIEGEDEKTGKPRMKLESVKCKNYR